MNKLATTTLAATFAAATSALADGGISVSDVTFSQNDKRDVIITYNLTGTESAVVTIDVCTNGVSIGEENFTTLAGDVNTIVAPDAGAAKRIYWKATKDWPEHKIDASIVTVTVNAWALSNPPDYFVLDLETGDRKYYASTNALPDGGLANDIYKTTKLVMRRIPAGGETFTMGYPTTDAGVGGSYDYYLTSKKTAMPPHQVSFNNDFYMAIYEMTAKQYAVVWPSQSNLAPDSQNQQTERQPRVNIPTANIRGSYKYWPRDGYDVQDSPNRFIKLIRAIGGGVVFDLPTEAQWEFACRAGSTTLWYDDISWNGTQSVSIDGRARCPEYMWADEWGRNLGAPQEVGLLKPNAYGLYDMHGNVAETCLDAWAYGAAASDGSAVVEPVGPEADDGNAYRVVKGGGYTTSKAECGSGMRSAASGSAYNGDVGFRLVCPAVAR